MGFYRGPNIVRDGLILALDSASERSYTEAATTWYDLTGVSNNGYISQGDDDSAAQGGVGMNTGNEYVNIAPSSSFNHFKSGNFTIETFVRSDNISNPRSRHPMKLGHTVTSSSTKGWSVGHQTCNNNIEVRVCDGTNMSFTDVSHFTLEESTFYHRIFTVDRATGCLTKCYINGKLVGSHDATNVTGEIYDPNQSSDSIGSGLVFGYCWGWRFIGSVNIIRAYNRILTDDEITQNYNALKNRFI
jgi:hypothetical protein